MKPRRKRQIPWRSTPDLVGAFLKPPVGKCRAVACPASPQALFQVGMTAYSFLPCKGGCLGKCEQIIFATPKWKPLIFMLTMADLIKLVRTYRLTTGLSERL